jgi:hypothetical protein
MAQAMARAAERVPADCRRDFEDRFGVDAVVRGYVEVYRAAGRARVTA